MKGITQLLSSMAAVTLAVSAAAQPIDTVRVGSASLRGTSLKQGAYSVESFMRSDGIDTSMSTTTQSVSKEGKGADRVYVIRTVHMSSEDTTRSSIVVRADNYALVHHRVKALRDSAAVTVSDLYLTGWVVLPDEPVSLLDRMLAQPVFAVEGQLPWLFPLLPLNEGYEAAIPHFSEWSRSEQWKTIRVTGSETIKVDGATYECWIVDGGQLFPGYGVTYWVDNKSRRVIQGVARGGDDKPEYWSRVRPG